MEEDATARILMAGASRRSSVKPDHCTTRSFLMNASVDSTPDARQLLAPVTAASNARRVRAGLECDDSNRLVWCAHPFDVDLCVSGFGEKRGYDYNPFGQIRTRESLAQADCRTWKEA